MKKVKIISACSDLGYANEYVDTFPGYLKTMGLEDMLHNLGIPYEDIGEVEGARVNKKTVKHSNCKLAEEVTDFSKRLAEKIDTTINFENDFLLTIGGDHSIGIGSIAGILRKKKKVGVLWLDAHPDANTPETTLTGWIYGMCTALLCGHGDERLLSINDKTMPWCDPKNFCIYGAQFIDPGEVTNVEKIGMSLISLDEITETGLANSLDKAISIISRDIDYIHVSLDLDVVDEFYAPGTSETSKGQLTYREIKYICRKLGSLGLVNSLDIVEGDPTKDIQGKTGKLALELIANILGYEYSEYTSYINENRV
jgi:arginase